MENRDHDLLICIDVKLSELKAQFSNHLKHHFLFGLAALTTAVTAVVALIIVLI